MKKAGTSLKLTVNRETLRSLDHQQSLREVGGGITYDCSNVGTGCLTTTTKYC
jgi:hypothetical protein